MRSAELLAAGYSLVFLVAGVTVLRRRPQAWRTAAMAVAGLGVALTAPLAAAIGGEMLGAWWLLGFLPLAYWMPAPLVSGGNASLEAWLVAVDRKLGLGPVVRAPALEVAYFLVYPLVPAGLLAVLAAGGLPAQTYWLGVLLAVLPCYALLPLLPSRPPRALLAGPPPASLAPVRALNVRFFAIFGNQWNTLPSGHAAGAVAVAVLVWRSGSALAPAFGVLAAGISAGTVSGRYHYLVDTVVGAALGALAATLAP